MNERLYVYSYLFRKGTACGGQNCHSHEIIIKWQVYVSSTLWVLYYRHKLKGMSIKHKQPPNIYTFIFLQNRLFTVQNNTQCISNLSSSVCIHFSVVSLLFSLPQSLFCVTLHHAVAHTHYNYVYIHFILPYTCSVGLQSVSWVF